MDTLASIDFLLLEYIKKHEPVSIEAIKNDLSSKIDSLEYRLEKLSTPKYHNLPRLQVAIDNSFYIEQEYVVERDTYGSSRHIYLGIYRLSKFGRKALQDFTDDKKNSRKKVWLENAWIPILVSIAANLVISGLKSLLPWILRLLSNVP